MANRTIYPYGTNGQLPSSIGVINDLITGGADKALSAEMGKELDRKYADFSQITLPAYTNAFILYGENKWGTRQSYKCALLPVQAGEIYRITAGISTVYAVLASGTPVDGSTPDYASGYTLPIIIPAGETADFTIPADGAFIYIPIRGTSANDYTPESVEKFIEGAKIDERIDDKIKSLLEAEQITLPNPISAFIAYSANKWVTTSPYKCVLLPVQPGEVYKITANANNTPTYAVLKSGNPVANSSPDYASGYTLPIIIPAGETADFTIPADGAFVYISIMGSNNKDYTPESVERTSKVEASVEQAVKRYSAQSSKFPTILHLGEPTDIIYSIDDFLMAHEYDEGQSIDNLKFSNDLGKTWITKQNIWGIIINVFMFSDGTLFFAAKNNNQAKCYWTRDFDTFTECTVLDQADGQGNRQAYTAPAGQNRWGVIVSSSKHTYIDEVEHYLFGDYVLSTANPRVWYAISDENGVTVRCAFVFGSDKIDGVTIPARHYHGFIYSPYNKYCYVLSGDNSDAECNVLRGRHDANHVWTWERLAYGVAYKIGDVVFDEGSMYFTTDYTDSSLVDKKGLISCPINDINVNRFRYWFHPSAAFMLEGSYRSSNPAAISSFINDNHGWRILGTDYAGNSKVLMAKGDHNFVWVDNDKNLKFKFFIGPNNKGDVYVWTYTPGYSVSGEDWIKFSHRKTINITEAMRNSGATDFFDGWTGTPR